MGSEMCIRDRSGSNSGAPGIEWVTSDDSSINASWINELLDRYLNNPGDGSVVTAYFELSDAEKQLFDAGKAKVTDFKTKRAAAVTEATRQQIYDLNVENKRLEAIWGALIEMSKTRIG